jgi:type I restriction-modification system DNA methylase subunit
MSLFQKSVEKKYLNELDSVLIDKKYKEFQDYFGNYSIQENIRNSKEEQFQEGFLRELFVSVFGYTLNPQPNFNLTTELKNIANSKKADGAILKGEDAIAVIELKGTDTTDLDKIETQAFGYKNHHPKCVYVITSNFEKLRFYIQNAVDHIDFDLFNLTREQFSLMWLCLAKDNLLNGLPQKIKESSLLQEENITKKLYADYSKFREAIYNNLVKNNPETDKLLLFKKTQKLLDRFLFIFFAEDRLLLPPNSISEIVKQWTTLKDELDEYVPLYDRFKKYFGYMNTGYKGKKYDIFAYNGGLFAPDEILDNISIDDEILHKHTLTLSQYDFETDVDVNILGHIFEHSLGEIENVQAEIKGEKIDTQKTRRKKDGIFYTPKYITKYIVENTVGKLCEEKRTELDIVDEEYAKGRKNRKKDTIKTLDDKLTDYRNWLLSLTILDPACGSGAFLNQALDFLIIEHRKIDDLRAQLFGSGLVFSDITTDILEKNIYGVDLNEESVEIAKLSLWLRTAQKGRKLNKLNNNIKCGNSLIDDPQVAGEKAFNWQNEFPEIFEKGGFDVVIGNPPYVNVELMPNIEKDFYRLTYETFYKRSDLFSLFVDLASDKLTKKGRISFIIPSIVLTNLSYKILRERLLSNNWLEEVCYTGGKVFSDATVDTVVITINKKKIKNIRLCNALDFINIKMQVVALDYFEAYQNTISIGSSESNSIFEKLFNSSYTTVDEHFNVFQGIVTGNNESYIFEDEEKIKSSNVDKSLLKPILLGRDISKWLIKDNTKRILYLDGKTEIDNFPNTKEWLTPFKAKLELRRECRKGVIPWYSLQWPREKLELDKTPKILLQRTRNESLKTRIVATLDETGIYGMESLIFLTPKSDKVSAYYFIAILNSKLINYLFATKFLNLAVKGDYLKKLQFPIIEGSLTLIDLSKKMLHFTQNLNDLVSNVIGLLQTKFPSLIVNQKLSNWYELEKTEFLKELKKGKVNLSLTEESEWIQYFKEQKEKWQNLKSELEETDRQIDKTVYLMYGLNDEEIKIVEESV